jgi:CheY-like chemotaxis protein
VCHALVIEDDYLAADYIAALAELAGATSTVIATTEDAAIRAAARVRPDIILCDIRLADGGRSARLESTRIMDPSRLCLLTGGPGASANSAGTSGVLAKPFEWDAFIKAFRTHASLSTSANNLVEHS